MSMALRSLLLFALWGMLACPQLGAQSAPNPFALKIVYLTNQVWQVKSLSTNAATTNINIDPGEGIRTDEGGEARLQRSDHSEVVLSEFSTLWVLGPNEECGNGFMRLIAGAFRHLGFDSDSRRVHFCTEHAFGGALGTDFELRVEKDYTVVAVYEGTVQIENASRNFPPIEIGPEQAARIDNVHPPSVFSFAATNEVQWWLHYPAILDPDELALNPQEKVEFHESVTAWRQGDIRKALASYPVKLKETSEGTRLYWVALQMAAGRVNDARPLVAKLGHSPAADGHRWLIAALLHESLPVEPTARSVTEHLGLSYLRQDQHRLKDALALAREATRTAPQFGLAWARRAELEFSHGDVRSARESLAIALTNSPYHPQAHALQGFVHLAANDIKRAEAEFETTRRLDPLLPDGWLGAGLVNYRRFSWDRSRQNTNGLAKLRLAVSLETNAASLHAYLGKAYADRDDANKASDQLKLAHNLDPKDPNPRLYSAFALYSQNRVNEAIGSLEESLALNDSRAVYRSRLVLDEDRAVRGTGLARLYQRAGLVDLSLREAAQAVASDYANYSSHLFLAESFDALRDPTRFNLRYETAWFNELLLANLLAPVGAGTFSPNVSQQEYMRLFTSEGPSILSVSDYRSDGQFRQLATQSGFIDKTAWSLDLDYQHNDGVRPNNQLDRIEWYTEIKQQVTVSDTAIMLVKYEDYKSGDNFQYLTPLDLTNGYSKSFHYDEDQQPIAVIGWRHEWSPGFQTIGLAGRLEGDYQFRQDDIKRLELVTNDGPSNLNSPIINLSKYSGQLQIYTAELGQIAQFNDNQHTLNVGGRFQSGTINTDYRFGSMNSNIYGAYPDEINVNRSVKSDLQRWSIYAYETWKPLKSVVLTTGVSYDALRYPSNFRSPPLQTGESTACKVLPKVALVWSPMPSTTIRGMFAKSLGGVSLDESFRLEPVQLAGFSQVFRTLIPESIAGSVSAPSFDVAGVALDLKLPARTYLGFHGDFLRSDVRQQIGLFEYDTTTDSTNNVGSIGSAAERLAYKENASSVTLDRLLGDEWSLGASYRFQSTHLDDTFPQLYRLGADSTRYDELHIVGMRAGWNHPDGWFSRSEINWYFQSHTYSSDITTNGHDDTCQVNLQCGWRFPRQHGEISAGILNLIGGDYRLDPLSGLPDFARKCVFFSQLKLYF